MGHDDILGRLAGTLFPDYSKDMLNTLYTFMSQYKINQSTKQYN